MFKSVIPISSLSLQNTISMAVCFVMLTGCTVGPNFSHPTNKIRVAKWQSLSNDNHLVPTQSSSLPSQWWTLFNDSVLTELENNAQLTNLDLQMAESRIEQSRAQLGITSSALLPNVSAGASYERDKLSENGRFAALGASTTPYNFWQTGFDASWELDLWGRTRRAREGAKATLEATEYDREAVRVSLSAEVARNYLQLRGTQTQLDIANQNKDIAEHTLKLALSREQNGISTRFETSTARAQLATINAMIPELTQQRNAYMNALALLMGEQPRALNSLLSRAIPLPSLPTHVPVGIPSTLVHRRPDILRAEAQLHTATASIGVAKADFYPSIGLTGAIDVEGFNSRDLSSWNSHAFSVGPTVYLPIFQGGRLKQRLALTEAQQKTAALAYRQTVLQAWHEVDNALDAWTSQQRQHDELLISYEQNKEALQIAERGYQEGATDYLNVLTAQRNVLVSQTSLNTSATSAALTLVNLYKSLGGGWNANEVVPQ